MKYSILVVDDEPAQRQLLNSVLEDKYRVVLASDGVEAVGILTSRSFDLIITDEKMPNMRGTELIKWIRKNNILSPIIVLTAYGSIQSAVEAMKLGAQDYLSKPLKSPEELRITVDKVLRRERLELQQIVSQGEIEAQFPKDIVADSDLMKNVISLADQVASQPTTILLTGESGVGKEVIARYIHRSSTRSENPFVAVNCAALTETLLGSELFGHEKGAFTGATTDKRGRFELAHGGTLFLDEIGEMGVELQTTFLRVLQEQQFERVGGTRVITVDVRVIAATNQDLICAIKGKTFREDLYYRLNVFSIQIPPLRERKEDIEPLIEFFLKKLSARNGYSLKTISSQATKVFQEYSWPGNVRELQNAIERALIVSRTNEIKPEDLPVQLLNSTKESGAPKTLTELERTAIIEALSRNRGDRRKTSEQLGISLRTLQSRLNEYGLTRKS
jgi:DNA-binding NtrC family response regulator